MDNGNNTKRGRRAKENKENIRQAWQATLPSMMASRNKNKSEKTVLVTVNTTSTSSDESLASPNTSKKCDAHSVYELNSSGESDTLKSDVDLVNKNTLDDDAENILFQKYFRIVPGTEDEKKNVTVVCVTCAEHKPNPVHLRGSKAATSNFVRHLRVLFQHFEIWSKTFFLLMDLIFFLRQHIWKPIQII